ncbi:Glycosyl hydrolase family 10 protein / carbohydrate-binding domain-containing protein isoform 2 [Hibiscus syriacus]|uniref:Glycosyl hydrolase family 10 protein / carbohydrate-binding domain-containing protein isoform 2 n=1 Tax=Hibiscus syriacus TaxID=106335 RepID=A0A6A3BFV7_HIBSY|nr:Glycosyl hydrolase family 10 protein / carbohydrate-binding domain-containing protein isoform 2 [Hibiscus syriacus]
MITEKLKLFFKYQISAWVRIGSGAIGPQNVNVALSVDGQWVNGGQVEIKDGRWHEIGGSFRIEKQPFKVIVYIQGPAAGLDLMVVGLQIFPVDRDARFKHFARQTDMSLLLTCMPFCLAHVDSKAGCCPPILRIQFKQSVRNLCESQTQNSFPIGSCINRTNIDNEASVDSFVKNFNWAVFGNELKRYWTEPQRGNFNYKDADDVLAFCQDHKIETRGPCIFSEVQSTVQQWIQAFNKKDLMTAVQNRLTGLLTRYKGKFGQYDVSNEMLHGSFYQDWLGRDIRAYIFKTADQLDPSATVFMSDYHVDCGCDTRSEKYIEDILDLQQQGAPVGVIGIQGHIDNPVGPVVSDALDKGEDLKVMLREAFAHPAVEGVMLWGFWELFMSRVDSEGEINETVKEAHYRIKNQNWKVDRPSTSIATTREIQRKSVNGESSEEQVRRMSRIIQGVMDEEVVRKLQKCLVGTMATVCSSSRVEDRLRSAVQPWSESYRASERVTWIKLFRVPLHCCNHGTFKRIAEQWGECLAMGENAFQAMGCEEMTILIATSRKESIDEVVDLEAGRDIFKIRVVEQPTSRSDNAGRKQEEKEATAMESVQSWLVCCFDGRVCMAKIGGAAVCKKIGFCWRFSAAAV